MAGRGGGGVAGVLQEATTKAATLKARGPVIKRDGVLLIEINDKEKAK